MGCVQHAGISLSLSLRLSPSLYFSLPLSSISIPFSYSLYLYYRRLSLTPYPIVSSFPLIIYLILFLSVLSLFLVSSLVFPFSI